MIRMRIPAMSAMSGPMANAKCMARPALEKPARAGATSTIRSSAARVPSEALRDPVDTKNALRMRREHPCEARAVLAVDRDAAADGRITDDRLRATRRAAPRKRDRQVADAFDLDGTA